MEWYRLVLSKYADFNGRARRKEFWMFVLFNFIFSTVAVILDNALGITFGLMEVGYGPIYTIYVLAVLIPSLAVTARRLHDTGKSGWLMLLALIPIVGGIIVLVFTILEGNAGANQYGPDPKEVIA